MDTPPEPDKKYLLNFLPGALTDVFGNINDSLVRSFKTSAIEDFGKLLLDLELPEESGSYILQLLDRSGLVLREQFVQASGMQVFDFLVPGNYGIRLIEDRNQNMKWDTGHYLRGLQPERVAARKNKGTRHPFPRMAPDPFLKMPFRSKTLNLRRLITGSVIPEFARIGLAEFVEDRFDLIIIQLVLLEKFLREPFEKIFFPEQKSLDFGHAVLKDLV
ncbi:MAG: hypothetical protein EOM17_15455, partial [Synergistales bacterium]|nr:hypothetical protein [Synergistales bacterium]